MQKKEVGSTEKKQPFGVRLDARAAKRNNGIDLLRIWCMVYVVATHSVSGGNWGGVLDAAQPGTVQYAAAALIQVIGICALDVFALLSGFVGYSDRQKPVRISGVLLLYLQAVSCGVFAALAFWVFRRDLVSLKDFFVPFFPITCSLYWYYTAYVGMFLVSPLLNAGLRALPKRTLRAAMIAMFAVFSMYTTVCDRFKLEAGYGMVWLILLYIMGGILKKCSVGQKLKPWSAFLGIAVLNGVTWLWRLYGMQFGAFGVECGRETLASLTSPTIVVASALYVIGFSKLRVGKFMARFAVFFSPCAFAVYLLNSSNLIRENLIQGRFVYLVSASPFELAGTVLVFSVGFVAASLLLDRVRLQLFELLHVPQMLSAIDDTAHKLVRKWIPNN